MHKTKGLLRLFESGFVSRLFLLLLLLSLPGIADGYVLLTLGEHYAKYAVLTAVALTGFIALFFVLSSAAGTITTIRRRIAEGQYPRREYARLAGLLLAGVLLLIPGFFTDAVGLLFYMPPVRQLVGMAITARHASFLREAYEYLKIGDM
jgi:UPF0716 protein FxsA